MNISKIKKQIRQQTAELVRVVLDSPNRTIFEMPSHIRTVRFNYKYIHVDEDKNLEESFYLALPYMQFIISRFNSNFEVEIGFTTSPMELGDKIYFPLLPNVSLLHAHRETNSFYVCDGLITKKAGYKCISAFEFVDVFWSSKFEQYYGNTRWPASVLIRDTPLRSYEKWEELTREKGLSLWDGVNLEDWKLPSKLL